MSAQAKPKKKLAPRRVAFDFESVPRHWILGRPFLTHLFNALHYLFEHGERWFGEVFRAALPQVEDENLRADVRGFIAQEATHSHHHTRFLEHMDTQGLRLRSVSAIVKRMLARVRRRASLHAQIAIIAAIEQYTALLSIWAFELGALESAHPAMRDLFLWHAAEEIEHKSVAFDLLAALRPGYFYRVTYFVGATFSLFAVWGIAMFVLLRRDQEASWRAIGADFFRSAREGSLPIGPVLRGWVQYLSPSFHPNDDDNVRVSEDYLTSRALWER